MNKPSSYNSLMRIAYYISGHGYGHASRSCVIVNALAEEHQVWIVTSVPRQFLNRNLKMPCGRRYADIDIGVIQPDSMTIDFRATIEALHELEARREKVLVQEMEWLAKEHIERVIADIPPLSCRAAAELGIPCAVITNFTWDDIYDPYEHDHPGFREAAQSAAADYARAWLFELPFATSMQAFHTRSPFGLIARTHSVDRKTVRQRLDFGESRLALLSFGGLGFGNSAPEHWDTPQEWKLIITGERPENLVFEKGVRLITPEQMTETGISYPDIVGAADVVLTKPGYGITSECIANRTPMIYTDRSPFAEYPCLVEGIKRHLPSIYIDQRLLKSGSIRQALIDIENQHWPEESLHALTPQEIRSGLAMFLGKEHQMPRRNWPTRSGGYL